MGNLPDISRFLHRRRKRRSSQGGHSAWL